MSVPRSDAVDSDRLKHLSAAVDSLKTMVLWTVTLGALLAFLCLVVREVCVARTIVDPIAVPDRLREQGFTPEVLSTVLIDRIARMTEGAVARKERAELAAGWRTADVVVPTLNLSLSATAGLFENLFALPDTRISGEVVRDAGVAETYHLLLRVSAAEDGWQVIKAADAGRGWAINDPVDKLFEEPAQALLLAIDPLSAATYRYITQAELATSAVALGDRYERGPIIDAINRCLETCNDGDRAAAYVLWANLLVRAADLGCDPALREEALERFERAVQTSEIKSDGYTKWADVLIRLGRQAEGFDKYKIAARSFPRDFRVPYNLGMRLAALGRHEEAVVQFYRAAKLDPSREWTFTALGDSLRALGQITEAERQYRQAVLLDGGIGAAYRGLAASLATQQGRQEEAQRMRERADAIEQVGVEATISATPRSSSAASPSAG